MLSRQTWKGVRSNGHRGGERPPVGLGGQGQGQASTKLPVDELAGGGEGQPGLGEGWARVGSGEAGWGRSLSPFAGVRTGARTAQARTGARTRARRCRSAAMGVNEPSQSPARAQPSSALGCPETCLLLHRRVRRELTLVVNDHPMHACISAALEACQGLCVCFPASGRDEKIFLAGGAGFNRDGGRCHDNSKSTIEAQSRQLSP